MKRLLQVTSTHTATLMACLLLTPATANANITNGGDALQLGSRGKNKPPVAESQSVEVKKNQAMEILLNAWDDNDDDITYTILTQPLSGILSGIAPNLIYTPNANVSGTDSFTFMVTDSKGASSEIATVSITVKGGGGGGGGATNQPPVANPQSVTVDQGVEKEFQLFGNDPEDGNKKLQYSLGTLPAHGKVRLDGSWAYYTCTDANFSGVDSFTFKVTDKQGASSAEATVSITVKAAPANQPPVANPQSVTTDQGVETEIKLTGNDPEDGNKVKYSLGATRPAHGKVELDGSTAYYTCTDANFSGVDSFTFKVTDKQGASSAEATVSITVRPNQPPVANAQSVTTDQGVEKEIKLSGNDPEDGNKKLKYSLVTQPAHGTVSLDGSTAYYTPAANFSGNDSFTFKVTDSKGASSSEATISITVRPNQPPVANAQSVKTYQGQEISIKLSGSDPEDGNKVKYILGETRPAHGTVRLEKSTAYYTPANNYSGSDSFTFKVTDSKDASSAEATVSITVKPLPVANAQSVTVTEDTDIALRLSGSDPDGQELRYEIVTQPAHGTLSGKDQKWTYKPNENYYGDDSFTFKVRVKDTDVYSAEAKVSITVTEVNDAPVATAQTVTVKEDTENGIAITLSGTDVDNDEITSYKIVTQPAHGKLSGTAPNVTYTPDENFNGQDTFTFRVKDSHGLSSEDNATVTINVTPVNDAPVATGQDLTTEEDTSIAITLSGSDVDGDTLTYVLETSPRFGTLSGTAPHLTYRPTANFSGRDTFKFKVTDIEGVSSKTAKVNIKVNSQVFQAESCANISDCTVSTNGGGFTGSGFVNMGGMDSSFEWNNVSAASKGNVTLGIRYANASATARPCSIIVNGVNAGTVALEPTGSWENWTTVNMTVPLKAGNNNIRIQASTSAGGPNVDSMMVSSNVPSSVYEAENFTDKNDCAKSVEWSGFTGSSFVDMGNNAGTWFEWNNVSAASAGDVTLGFRYANAYAAARPCTILVNGVSAGVVSFDGTLGWDIWNTASIKVPVNAGNNTIRVLATTSEAGPNVDSMMVSSVASSKVYQSEAYIAKHDCAVSTDATGYIGTGYVNMGGKDSWFELNTIAVPAAGSYTLSLRYAFKGDHARPCSIIVNGVDTGNVTFNSTGSDNSWSIASITVPLNEGNNTIRIQANTDQGGPNVDTLNIK